jgi:uncharacterized BrkB/YihY/UPF0761 family membrane protein
MNIFYTPALTSLADHIAETMPPLSATSFWSRILEISPAIAALLAVIFWLYKLIVAKDKTMEALVRAGQGDIERQSKMITLLEMLVHQGTASRGSK